MKPRPQFSLAPLLLLLSAGPPAAAGATAPGGGIAIAPADSIRYATRVTDNNLCGLNLTNYGFLGNNFVSRAPSFEYPLGSGYDHLPRGGLWIGARATDPLGSFTGVTTACEDGSSGSSPLASTEFTPAGMGIHERSRLVTSPVYDPEAISEEDLIGFYSDEPARAFSPENHRPLNVLVRQESYDWSVFDAAHLVVLRFVITNLGACPLDSVHVGLYTEFASGNKNLYPTWPPSSSGPAGSWYRKAWVQYDDSLRLLREHYCAASPAPSACNLSSVPAWVGLKLLGVRATTPADTGQRVTLAAWNYSPFDTTRNEDVKRYAIMSSGHIQDLSRSDLQPSTGDPCELLAVGPFATMGTGDSIAVTFALVGGTEIADIQQHARVAQRLYDAGYDITVPVEASLVSAEAEPGLARIRWFTSAGASRRWTVQRSESGAPWTTLGGIETDGEGYAIFEDRSVIAGARYGYRLESSRGDALGEAWVDVPRAFAFALLGAAPNPARSGIRVSFTLAEAGAVRIDLLDLAGRRVLARDFGSLAAGAHVERLDHGGLAPGTYFVRLRQSGRTAARPVVLLE
jgi:hypothetical protein